jgi:hypothetical protein
LLVFFSQAQASVEMPRTGWRGEGPDGTGGTGPDDKSPIDVEETRAGDHRLAVAGRSTNLNKDLSHTKLEENKTRNLVEDI